MYQVFSFRVFKAMHGLINKSFGKHFKIYQLYKTLIMKS